MYKRRVRALSRTTRQGEVRKRGQEKPEPGRDGEACHAWMDKRDKERGGGHDAIQDGVSKGKVKRTNTNSRLMPRGRDGEEEIIRKRQVEDVD